MPVSHGRHPQSTPGAIFKGCLTTRSYPYEPEMEAPRLATLPLFGMSAAQAAVLTSLEWPPYTSANLPEQGKSSRVVTAAFAWLATR